MKLSVQRLLMPKGEAARYLGTSPRTFDTWGIPAKVRPDGRRVYDRRDLDAFAAELPYDGEEAARHETGWEDVA